MGWFVSEWKLQHPVHGTFFVSRLLDNGRWAVLRVYSDPESNIGANIVEQVGAPRGTVQSLAEALRAADVRIAELDAIAAGLADTSAPTVRTEMQGEQLEASR